MPQSNEFVFCKQINNKKTEENGKYEENPWENLVLKFVFLIQVAKHKKQVLTAPNCIFLKVNYKGDVAKLGFQLASAWGSRSESDENIGCGVMKTITIHN